MSWTYWKRFKTWHTGRHPINKIGGCQKSFSPRNLGTPLVNIKALVTSIRCLFFLSATLFCWCVLENELWCTIPLEVKKLPRWSLKYSLPCDSEIFESSHEIVPNIFFEKVTLCIFIETSAWVALNHIYSLSKSKKTESES